MTCAAKSGLPAAIGSRKTKNASCVLMSMIRLLAGNLRLVKPSWVRLAAERIRERSTSSSRAGILPASLGFQPVIDPRAGFPAAAGWKPAPLSADAPSLRRAPRGSAPCHGLAESKQRFVQARVFSGGNLVGFLFEAFREPLELRRDALLAVRTIKHSKFPDAVGAHQINRKLAFWTAVAAQAAHRPLVAADFFDGLIDAAKT